MRHSIATFVFAVLCYVLVTACGSSAPTPSSEVKAPSLQVCVDGKQQPIMKCHPNGQCYWYNPCTGQRVPAPKPSKPNRPHRPE